MPESDREFPTHLTSMESTKSEQTPSIPSPQHTEVSSTTVLKDRQLPGQILAHIAAPTTAVLNALIHHRSCRNTNTRVIAKSAPRTHDPAQRATLAHLLLLLLLPGTARPARTSASGLSRALVSLATTSSHGPRISLRHENTIHDVRQKVRCQYCTEEKTFSRSDVLVRHIRCVHPRWNSLERRAGEELWSLCYIQRRLWVRARPR